MPFSVGKCYKLPQETVGELFKELNVRGGFFKKEKKRKSVSATTTNEPMKFHQESKFVGAVQREKKKI